MRRATLTDIDAMHVVRLAVRENVLSDVARVTPTHYRNVLEVTIAKQAKVEPRRIEVQAA